MLGFFGVLGQEAANPPPPVPQSYGAFLLQSLLVLVAVCLLSWAVVKLAIPRLLGVKAPGRGPLRVVARLTLEPRRSVYLVEAAGKYLLLGASEQGPMAVLAELSSDEVRAALDVQAAAPRRSFLEVLKAKAEPPK